MNKSRIDIVFNDKQQTTIPCFTILSPFIVNKMERQQGADIKSITVTPISNDEYTKLLKVQNFIYDEELFHQHFWNATGNKNYYSKEH